MRHRKQLKSESKCLATKSPADLVSSEVPDDFFIFINLARPRASVVASVLSTTALLCGVASGVLAMALMTLHSLWSGGGSTVGEEVGLAAAMAVVATLLFNSGEDGVDVICFRQKAFFVFCKRTRNYYLLADQADCPPPRVDHNEVCPIPE